MTAEKLGETVFWISGNWATTFSLNEGPFELPISPLGIAMNGPQIVTNLHASIPTCAHSADFPFWKRIKSVSLLPILIVISSKIQQCSFGEGNGNQNMNSGQTWRVLKTIAIFLLFSFQVRRDFTSFCENYKIINALIFLLSVSHKGTKRFQNFGRSWLGRKTISW